jgi:hypothetical protein
MPRLTGVSDRDAGLGAKIAYFFTKRRFKQMTGLETATMLEPLRMYAYIPKLLNAYGRLELAESKMDILSPRHRALAELKTWVRRSRAAGGLPMRNCSRYRTTRTPPASPTSTSSSSNTPRRSAAPRSR